jgi:hypothetical protein
MMPIAKGQSLDSLCLQRIGLASETMAGAWKIAGTCVVCLYLLGFRVYDLENSFALLGEQVRDWSLAQRNFNGLPWDRTCV